MSIEEDIIGLEVTIESGRLLREKPKELHQQEDRIVWDPTWNLVTRARRFLEEADFCMKLALQSLKKENENVQGEGRRE